VNAVIARSAILVTHYYPAHGGGVEIVAGEVAARLTAGRAFSIEWFASDVDPAPDVAGIAVRPQPTFNGLERSFGLPFPLWSPLAFPRIFGAIRRCDVVHVHDGVYLANFFAALCARAMRKRLVVTQHIGAVPYRSAVLRTLLSIANWIVGHVVLRHADATVFVSPVVRAYFERLVGPSARFSDLANGVDTRLFSPPASSQDRAARKAALGIPSGTPLLLFVGRHVEKKGLDLVRELASRSTGWRWCLIGEGPIDPRHWRLPNVSTVNRLPQRELVDWYRAADLLVLPSVGEGFPLVVQEALSCGLPVAVHTETRDAGGLPNGICLAESVCEPDSVARWLEALRIAMSETEEVQEDRRTACRAFACRHWSWDATTRRYAELLL
jgi:glycosyltransferase involved in cell wall biosynthesis